MRKEAKMEMLCHVKCQEVEYGLTKHRQYRHILELQQIGNNLPGPELGPISVRSDQTTPPSHSEKPLEFFPICYMSDIVSFLHTTLSFPFIKVT